MARGQTEKAYLRIDPDLDQHADPLGMLLLICAANRQAARGRFHEPTVLRLLGKKRAGVFLKPRAGKDKPDLVLQADGLLYLDGWDDWQEGDITVGERMARIRAKRRNLVTPEDTAKLRHSPSHGRIHSRNPGRNSAVTPTVVPPSSPPDPPNNPLLGVRHLASGTDNGIPPATAGGDFDLPVGWPPKPTGPATTTNGAMTDSAPPTPATPLEAVALAQARLGIPRPAKPAPAWSHEAADDWFGAYGGPPLKAFFAALEPIVRRHEWPRVRPVLRFYLAETASEFVNIAKLGAAFLAWEERSNGKPATSRRGPPVPL